MVLLFLLLLFALLRQNIEESLELSWKKGNGVGSENDCKSALSLGEEEEG